MSPVRAICRRTVGSLFGNYSVAFIIAGFLAAVAALFAFNLDSGEGGQLTLATIWTMSVGPFLPALAAFLGMDCWSDEKRSGRIDMLLSSPVRERDFTLGKFYGVVTMCALSVFIALLATVVPLAFFAPSAWAKGSLASFLPGFVALGIQGVLWCAVSVAMSALFRHAAAAAVASIFLLVGVPRGGWAALIAWAPQGSTVFGEMPLDAQLSDMSVSYFSSSVVLSYVILTIVALFLASKFIVFLRFHGHGALGLKFTTTLAIVLSLVFSVIAVTLVCRTDFKVDVPVRASDDEFSKRTRDILLNADGDITITCFLSRKDARFRSIGYLLRSLQRESETLGGVRIQLRFVDPRWDVGTSERLVRLGAQPESLIFERGYRAVVVPLSDGYSERLCASTIQRLTMQPQRRHVYWTKGHGEIDFGVYDSFGMSDIARELLRDGYRNQTIDLAAETQIPKECALIVVAGARTDFSRAELDRLDAYLREGGRLLVLLSSAETGGVVSRLPLWGMRPSTVTLGDARTISGSNVIADDFGEHAITRPLRGSRIVLEKPLSFEPTAAVETGTGADRLGFTSLVRVDGATVVAAVERGAGAGADLSIRPTRIVAIGDAGFVVNGQLTSRANANRDFFLNCIAYLSGIDASTASGVETDILVTSFDRSGRVRYAITAILVIPSVLFLVFAFVIFRRRRRK